MSLTNGRQDELWRLVEAVCEDELTPAQAARLEELLLADREARSGFQASRRSACDQT
jgi:hypothetical protein